LRICSFLVIPVRIFPCFFARKPKIRPIPVPVMEPTAITMRISNVFMFIGFLLQDSVSYGNFFPGITIYNRILKNKRQYDWPERSLQIPIQIKKEEDITIIPVKVPENPLYLYPAR
jgi:hypothetical protein